MLLIGARKKDVEEELGIDIDEQKETERSADLFQELKMKKENVPLKPLLKGKFPKKEEIPGTRSQTTIKGRISWKRRKNWRKGSCYKVPFSCCNSKVTVRNRVSKGKKQGYRLC